MMIGTCESRRSSRQTSNPEPSGSITSSSTRSGSRRRLLERLGHGARDQRLEALARERLGQRLGIELSSSTRRMVRFGLLIPGL